MEYALEAKIAASMGNEMAGPVIAYSLLTFKLRRACFWRRLERLVSRSMGSYQNLQKKHGEIIS